MAYFAGLHTSDGLTHVPGRYRSERAAHAAARYVAHTAGLHWSQYETVAARAPTVAETVALTVAAAAFALAPCIGFLLLG